MNTSFKYSRMNLQVLAPELETSFEVIFLSDTQVQKLQWRLGKNASQLPKLQKNSEVLKFKQLLSAVGFCEQNEEQNADYRGDFFKRCKRTDLQTKIKISMP